MFNSTNGDDHPDRVSFRRGCPPCFQRKDCRKPHIWGFPGKEKQPRSRIQIRVVWCQLPEPSQILEHSVIHSRLVPIALFFHILSFDIGRESYQTEYAFARYRTWRHWSFCPSSHRQRLSVQPCLRPSRRRSRAGNWDSAGGCTLYGRNN